MAHPDPTRGPVCGSKTRPDSIKDGTLCRQQSPVPGIQNSCPKPIFKGAKCLTLEQAVKELEKIPPEQTAWRVGSGVTGGWIKKGKVISTPKGDIIIMGVSGYSSGYGAGGLIYIQKGKIYETPLDTFHEELRHIGHRTGYSRAKGMMDLLETEVDFIIGVMSVVTGTTLVIALVEGGKSGKSIYDNRKIIMCLPAIIVALTAARKALKQVAPNLYSYIFDTILAKLFDNLPSATAKAAFSVVVSRYTGKLVGSLGWQGFQSKTETLKKVSKEILSFIAFKGVPGAAMAVKDDYKKLGGDLMAALRKIGAAALREPNALAIAKEITEHQDVISRVLKEIIDAVEGVEKRRKQGGRMSPAEISEGLRLESELFMKAPPGQF